MGLYLAVFNDDGEVDGLDVGSYDDFWKFRNQVTEKLEGEIPGSIYPTLILHSDSDGEWSPNEANKLESELVEIERKFNCLPAVLIDSSWKRGVIETFNLKIKTLNDSFFDVNGEHLIERMISLSKLSQEISRPILFQ